MEEKIYKGNIYVKTQEEVENIKRELESYNTIDGDIIIGSTCSGSFKKIDICEIAAFLTITHIKGDLIIKNTNALLTLSHLRNLQVIEGSFIIKDNNILCELESFNKLESIGSSFVIESNPCLEHIGNFDSLRTIGKDF